jgi:hypothetical protein
MAIQPRKQLLVRRLPLLLLLATCACDRERPRGPSREPPPPIPVSRAAPAKAGPEHLTYREAAAAYLGGVRALPKLVQEVSKLSAYTKALDETEDLFGRVPYAPPGYADIERALKAVRKSAKGCQEALERYERSVAAELGVRRLDRGEGKNPPEVERAAQRRTQRWEQLRQSGDTLRARIERVEELLSPRP